MIPFIACQRILNAIIFIQNLLCIFNILVFVELFQHLRANFTTNLLICIMSCNILWPDFVHFFFPLKKLTFAHLSSIFLVSISVRVTDSITINGSPFFKHYRVVSSHLEFIFQNLAIHMIGIPCQTLLTVFVDRFLRFSCMMEESDCCSILAQYIGT